MRITLQPETLQWARERAGLSEEALAHKFSKKEAERWETKIETWEQDGELTYKQAENLAKYTYTPFGYLFSSKPPQESQPIPDFRTHHSAQMREISPHLRSVIHQSQRRQEWYRDHLLETEESPLPYVGKFPPKIETSYIVKVAEDIRQTLGFTPSDSRKSDLASIISELSAKIEEAGVLVVRAGKVGNNTRRTLDPEEFRGFALVDPYAPLIFINTADTKAAQIFTMAHELAHIWAGESALSNLKETYAPEQKLEQFCNAVAAEYLVPLASLRRITAETDQVDAELLRKLRLHFRVSELVALRRLKDLGMITRQELNILYAEWIDAYQKKNGGDGGNFHNSQPLQVGRRFGEALVASTLEGKTQYRDAYSLLDMKKQSSFETFAKNLGIKP